jgi:hypothetical protein
MPLWYQITAHGVFIGKGNAFATGLGKVSKGVNGQEDGVIIFHLLFGVELEGDDVGVVVSFQIQVVGGVDVKQVERTMDKSGNGFIVAGGITWFQFETAVFSRHFEKVLNGSRRFQPVRVRGYSQPDAVYVVYSFTFIVEKHNNTESYQINRQEYA